MSQIKSEKKEGEITENRISTLITVEPKPEGRTFESKPVHDALDSVEAVGWRGGGEILKLVVGHGLAERAIEKIVLGRDLEGAVSSFVVKCPQINKLGGGFVFSNQPC